MTNAGILWNGLPTNKMHIISHTLRKSSLEELYLFVVDCGPC